MTKKGTKHGGRALSILLTLSMVLTLITLPPVAVSAATGMVTIDVSTLGEAYVGNESRPTESQWNYWGDNNLNLFTEGGNYTLTGTNGSLSVNVFASGANITLNNLNITNSSTNYAFSVNADGCTITLAAGSVNTVTSLSRDGFAVNSDCEINGSGSLTATTTSSNVLHGGIIIYIDRTLSITGNAAVTAVGSASGRGVYTYSGASVSLGDNAKLTITENGSGGYYIPFTKADTANTHKWKLSGGAALESGALTDDSISVIIAGGQTATIERENPLAVIILPEEDGRINDTTHFAWSSVGNPDFNTALKDGGTLDMTGLTAAPSVNKTLTLTDKAVTIIGKPSITYPLYISTNSNLSVKNLKTLYNSGSSALLFTADATLTIEGECVIENTSGSSSGIQAQGSLTINQTAAGSSLKAIGTYRGISLTGTTGSATLTVNTDLTAECSGISSSSTALYSARPTTAINGTGSLALKGGQSGMLFDRAADTDVTISGLSALNISGHTYDGICFYYSRNHTLTLNLPNPTTISGGNYRDGIFFNVFSGSNAYKATINNLGAAVTFTGGASGNGIGNYLRDLTLTGNTINAIGTGRGNGAILGYNTPVASVLDLTGMNADFAPVGGDAYIFNTGYGFNVAHNTEIKLGTKDFRPTGGAGAAGMGQGGFPTLTLSTLGGKIISTGGAGSNDWGGGLYVNTALTILEGSDNTMPVDITLVGADGQPGFYSQSNCNVTISGRINLTAKGGAGAKGTRLDYRDGGKITLTDNKQIVNIENNSAENEVINFVRPSAASTLIWRLDVEASISQGNTSMENIRVLLPPPPYNSMSVRLISSDGIPIITSPNAGVLPRGEVGVPYSLQMTATNNPTSWGVVTYYGDLPDGLTLNNSGLLSGTPTAAGAYSIKVHAGNSSGSSNYMTYRLIIAGAGGAGNITADFTDANFKAAVYRLLHKDLTEDIFTFELAGVTELDVGSKNIASLSGIQHFADLEILYCSGNTFTSLPPLPSGLKELHCNSNYNLTSLPTLPSGLKELHCNSNYNLTSLPTLPSGLERLSCVGNKLTSLPALPSALKYLYCGSNRLTSLPTLPANLEYLDCDTNFLTSLPALPAKLEYLECEDNQLTVLPELPPGLKELYCDYNLLTLLPTLPNGLEYLECDYNRLTSLPALPPGLRELYCENNLLTALPNLPAALEYLNCGGNPLTALPDLASTALTGLDVNNARLTALPALPTALKYLYCQSNLLTALPVLPAGLEYLDCSQNRLTTINVTGLTSLSGLSCLYNYMPDENAVTGYNDQQTWLNFNPQHTNSNFKAVTFINGLPRVAYAGVPLTLTGTVYPEDATNKDIVWSIGEASYDGTNPTIEGDVFTASAGWVEVIATITDGNGEGKDFEWYFWINVLPYSGGDIEIESVSAPDGNKVTVTLTRARAGMEAVIVAVYNKNGKLLAMKADSTTNKKEIELTLSNIPPGGQGATDAYRIKAFVWGSMNNMQPLCMPYTLVYKGGTPLWDKE